MRLPILLCIIALISTSACSEEIFYFADDHYKSIAAPRLSASISNPLVEPGRASSIKVVLANGGKLEELIPTSALPGSEEAASREMSEEMRCIDAYNITARLSSEYPITVTSQPCHLTSLLAGDVAALNFSVYAPGDASGDFYLPLEVSFDRQTDVSILSGTVSPLYQPANFSQRLRVTVVGEEGSFRLVGSECELSPGSKGEICLLIKGPDRAFENCTARLISRPPFHISDGLYAIGSMGPGEVAAARFYAEVDEGVAAKEYQLGCEIIADGKTSIVAVPVALVEKSSVVRSIALGMTAIAVVALVLQVLRLSVKGRRRLRPLR